MKQEKTTVVEHRLFHGEYRQLTLAAPSIGPRVRPGQFAHIKIPRLEEAVLRRPFSIFKADEQGISILYKSVGKGTDSMRSIQPGEQIDVVGPLGNGFPGLSEGKTVPVLVAGGYGNAALYLQAATLPRKGVAFFGGRTAEDILCIEEFEALGWDVRVTTNDGSLGTEGMVTAALNPWLEEQESGVGSQESGVGSQKSGVGSQESGSRGLQEIELFACGPNAMLKVIGDIATDNGLAAWLSMDRNMACGVGACLTCVIKRKTETGWDWARCCKDGPVFNAEEIIWEE